VTVTNHELELVSEIRDLALRMLQFDQMIEQMLQVQRYSRAAEYRRAREYAAIKRSGLLRRLWNVRHGGSSRAESLQSQDDPPCTEIVACPAS